ncbi:hypothetical protein ACMFMF_009782 [Clarireedia jacksonii]
MNPINPPPTLSSTIHDLTFALHLIRHQKYFSISSAALAAELHLPSEHRAAREWLRFAARYGLSSSRQNPQTKHTCNNKVVAIYPRPTLRSASRDLEFALNIIHHQRKRFQVDVRDLAGEIGGDGDGDSTQEEVEGMWREFEERYRRWFDCEDSDSHGNEKEKETGTQTDVMEIDGQQSTGIDANANANAVEIDDYQLWDKIALCCGTFASHLDLYIAEVEELRDSRESDMGVEGAKAEERLRRMRGTLSDVDAIIDDILNERQW